MLSGSKNNFEQPLSAHHNVGMMENQVGAQINFASGMSASAKDKILNKARFGDFVQSFNPANDG